MGREYRLGQLVDWFPLPVFFSSFKRQSTKPPPFKRLVSSRQYDLSMANLRELESWEHRCNVTLVTYQPFLMSTLGKYRTKSWFAKLHKSSFLPSLILLPLFFAFISNSSREESTPHNRKSDCSYKRENCSRRIILEIFARNPMTVSRGPSTVYMYILWQSYIYVHVVFWWLIHL